MNTEPLIRMRSTSDVELFVGVVFLNWDMITLRWGALAAALLDKVCWLRMDVKVSPSVDVTGACTSGWRLWFWGVNTSACTCCRRLQLRIAGSCACTCLRGTSTSRRRFQFWSSCTGTSIHWLWIWRTSTSPLRLASTSVWRRPSTIWSGRPSAIWGSRGSVSSPARSSH